MSNLGMLNLQYNQLIELPIELSQLQGLRVLHLRSNNLRIIPRELGQLNNLMILDISRNPSLQSPPPEVVSGGITSVLAYLRKL
jgi:Leucine-rich repeat (LRR) protein